MFNQFGESSACKDGKGGLFVNDVYRLTDSGEYFIFRCDIQNARTEKWRVIVPDRGTEDGRFEDLTKAKICNQCSACLETAAN